MIYNTETFKSDKFTPARFESEGTVTIGGKKIPYHTVSEDNVFYNDKGEPIASIFSYSYFRKDVKNTKDRPVVFAYNGGPGSSSMYVHAGFLGARRITYGDPDRPSSFGPYEVVENGECLLDIADIVLVDPVGTGYGVLIDKEEGKNFLGIEEDAEALLNFIEAWLRRYDRMLSPKYLIGESYGCTRSATAAGIAATQGKERSYGIAFDGIVFIGNTVTVGEYFGQGLPVERSVLGFPTYAAVNWYHNKPSRKKVEDFVKEAKKFADEEYFPALYKGENLSKKEKEHILERVSYYAGVSRDYLIRNGLKIDDATFRQEVIREKGRSVSRYDGRVSRDRLEPEIDEQQKALWDDATDDRWTSYFYAATVGDLLPGLGVKLDRNYIASTNYYMDWNKTVKSGTTGEQLRNAMSRRHGMRVFFANGWYDLCTETGYVYHTLSHASLPKDRTFFKGYKSGHMIYIGEDNIKELTDDIRKFLLGKDPSK